MNLEPIPATLCPCTVCGELVWFYSDNDDVICTPCYDKNFRGAMPVIRPPIAPLANIPTVRRRALATLDRQRWPLTRGGDDG